MTEERQPDHERQPDQGQSQEQQGQPGAEQEDATTLRAQLEEALREKDQFRALAQRAQADLINYRKRVSEEMDEVRRNAKADLLLKLLSVVDDFNRALAMVPEDAVAPGWLEGLRLVERKLETLLQSEGVTRIAAEGERFEPWVHEALFFEETQDTEEGRVTKVIREGYKLHDKVLRAAQVAVSKQPSQDSQPQSSEQEG